MNQMNVLKTITECLNEARVSCVNCVCIRFDDEDRPYCWHINDCYIDQHEDSLPLFIRCCYVPRDNPWKMFDLCLAARLCAINNLAVGFHEGGPYAEREEVAFAMKIQSISNIGDFWMVAK